MNGQKTQGSLWGTVVFWSVIGAFFFFSLWDVAGPIVSDLVGLAQWPVGDVRLWHLMVFFAVGSVVGSRFTSSHYRALFEYQLSLRRK